MPPIAIGLGIAGVASGAAGVVGHLANKSAQDRAAILQEKGVQEWLDIQFPDKEKQKLVLQRFVSAGELDPSVEEAIWAQDTELKQIQSDPKLKEARMRSLGALEEIGYGGESFEDQAAQEQALIESGSANRGRQQAIVSDMERRGQLGTGLELSARLDEQQAEGDRLAQTTLGLERDRRLRGLNAIMGAGELAGDIQSDEYEMDRDAATAADAIRMFNTRNSQDVMSRNVDRKNRAAEQNLANDQRILDQNVGTSNFEQQYNKELDQRDFENRMKRAAGVSGQYGQQAAQEIESGKNAAQMWGNIASGVGQIGLGAAKWLDDKEKLK